MIRLGLCCFLLLFAGAVSAHKPSDSYLTVEIEGRAIQGQWDIALRDLEYAIGLDDSGDGQITWGELKAHHDGIAAYALARLTIAGDGRPCDLRAGEQLVERHTDGAYTVLRFRASCPGAPDTLEVGYRLFFDLDPSHRGLLRLVRQGQTQTAVFGPEQPRLEFDSAAASPWRAFADFAREGVWHIWVGYDHILFLLSLLLPSVVSRRGRSWLAVASFRPALIEVLKVVTAFTAAHSITLSLAALGFVNLPSRWVESAIAASVLLAALNNLYPLVTSRLWLCAFGFGLVHGLGFASVLGDLGLPKDSLITALVAFNLGVEAGQAAIVGLFLPPAFWLRDSWFYQRLTLGYGSALIAAVALFWLIDRSLALGWLA